MVKLDKVQYFSLNIYKNKIVNSCKNKVFLLENPYSL
jgi:hypothetical protein